MSFKSLDIAVRLAWRPKLAVLAGLWAVVACARDGEGETRPASPQQEAPQIAEDAGTEPAVIVVDSSQRPGFCRREAADDPIRKIFCVDPTPVVGSLEDLQNLIELNPRHVPEDVFDAQLYFDPTREAAVLGLSTALPGHIISPINPRLIMMGGKAVMAYQRGVQRVELATRSLDTYAVVLYLVTFQQACSHAAEGCKPGDLYTARVESDWTSFMIEDDEQMKNTASDCRQCHRRSTESSLLLMRELQSPWTHFFFPAEQDNSLPGENGSALMRDYRAAKGDERYGGLDLTMVSPLGPFNLQSLVGREQPLLFDAPKIEDERWPYGPDGYAKEIAGSPTWENAYAAFKRGEQLALPYLELRATDRDKQAALADAYQRYRAGELAAEELPDLGDIYPDDPRLRARIGLETEPDASPAQALVQACAGCHNDVLDQSVSRARFNVAIARLERGEIDLAIERIRRPRDVPGAMPPPDARQLAPDVRDRLLDYLRGDLDPETIDPMLEQAASRGMTGGGNIGMAGPTGFIPSK